MGRPSSLVASQAIIPETTTTSNPIACIFSGGIELLGRKMGDGGLKFFNNHNLAA
jgi:hypothetical protein